jgi:hypothetical protein
MPIVKRLAGMGLRALATKVDGQVAPQQRRLPTVQRPAPLPYAPPPEHQLPAELQSHPVAQMLNHMLSTQTQQIMQYQDQRLRELEELYHDPGHINVTTSHNIDRSTHDYSQHLDNRRWTHVDSRHIEAKNRLHPDWCFGLITVVIVGLVIIGCMTGAIHP